MDKPKTTPKDFFLWAGAMIALYASVFAFLGLVFNYINFVYPDPLAYYPTNPYDGGVSYEMAMLIILVPVFLILMRFIHNTIAQDATRAEIWIRRWALYLILFVAGVTIVGDLIVLLNTFLRGDELTVRFILKALLVFLVAGAGFLHFLADLRGYWDKNRDKSKVVSIGVALLVVITVISGFFIIGSPREARLYRFDEQKISDLESTQYQIVYYWQQKQALPKTLSDLNDPISGFKAPQDAQTGDAYTYEVIGPMTFKLCATFNYESRERGVDTRVARPIGSYADVADSWSHSAGFSCFERTIDPDRYPPINKAGFVPTPKI